MKILRIPNRYKKQLSRLKNNERLFIFDSLMKLSCGENVQLPNDIIGDILELIWRDSVQMDKKNKDFDGKSLGNLFLKESAGNPPSNPHTEGKGREGKGKEVKGSEVIINNNETKVSYGNEDINKIILFLRDSVGVDSFKAPKGASERMFGRHCLNLLKKIGKDEFINRLNVILSEPFKAKNCNNIQYLYDEVKSFIHSPKVEPKEQCNVKKYF